MSEQCEFQTETSRLLDLVANALYSEQEIFLRELVSNASDACDRLRYAAIAKPELLGDESLKIRISIDSEARVLRISDNGIGMNKEELMKNLGTIAHSGTREILKNLDDGNKDVNLIGQFGVGFYSAFIVSNEVEVVSRKAGDAKGWIWVSDGKGTYTIDEHEKDTCGTEITLHLKDSASEFLLEAKIKQVIKKYSDHIGFPIVLGDGDAGLIINKASALWMRPKSEITEDEYKEFYHHVSGAMGMDKPWMTLHWRAEGAFEYNNLLFIPEMKPFDLYDPSRSHGLKLFVKRVFITDGLEGLIPPFLRFIKGVVDSEDLPLNISREMLQNNPMVAKMSSSIARKILSELQKKAEKDPKSFEQFWAQFGPVIKEGLYDAHTHRDALTKVVRFYSTKAEGLTSLEDYVSRMKEGQDQIYYLSAPDLLSAKNSPQLEAFKAKGIEVIFMLDAIDEFWIPIQADFKGKKFQSITKGAVNLPKDEKDDEKEEQESIDQTEKLVARLKDILLGEVKDVCLSERLVNSPVCLVAPDTEVDIHMQRVLKKTQGYEGLNQHILEINPKHSVILKMKEMIANDGDKKALKDTAFLLLDQAKIVEGEPLSNPSEFVRRMTWAIEKGLMAK